MTELAAVGSGVVIDEEAILKTLKLDPRDPNTQALLLVCRRYQLDPVLRHMVLVDGRPYITRDGLLHIAHLSGQLDGIEIIAEGEDDTHLWAMVAVYRKDMTHPFRFRGRYPRKGGNQKYAPEMAVKCAEVMALRRAFDVTGIGTVEEQWIDPEPPAVTRARQEAVLPRDELRDLHAAIREHPDAEMIGEYARSIGAQPDRVTRGQAEQIYARLLAEDGDDNDDSVS